MQLLQAGDTFLSRFAPRKPNSSNKGTGVSNIQPTLMDYSFSNHHGSVEFNQPNLETFYSSSVNGRPLKLHWTMIFWRKSLPSTTLPKTNSSPRGIFFPEVKTRCEFQVRSRTFQPFQASTIAGGGSCLLAVAQECCGAGWTWRCREGRGGAKKTSRIFRASFLSDGCFQK